MSNVVPTAARVDRLRRERASVLNFVEQRWIAESSSRADCGRSFGSGASIDLSSAKIRAGTSRPFNWSIGNDSACLSRISSSVRPTNGTRPESKYQKVTPREEMSERVLSRVCLDEAN